MYHASSAAWTKACWVLQGAPAHHGSLPTEAKSSLPLVACHVPALLWQAACGHLLRRQ